MFSASVRSDSFPSTVPTLPDLKSPVLVRLERETLADQLRDIGVDDLPGGIPDLDPDQPAAEHLSLHHGVEGSDGRRLGRDQPFGHFRSDDGSLEKGASASGVVDRFVVGGSIGEPADGDDQADQHERAQGDELEHWPAAPDAPPLAARSRGSARRAAAPDGGDSACECREAAGLSGSAPGRLFHGGFTKARDDAVGCSVTAYGISSRRPSQE